MKILQRGFRCSPEKHLWRSGLKLAIYQRMAAVTWVKSRQAYGVYHSSIQNLADYFGVLHQSAQRAVSELIDEGWLRYVEPKQTCKTSARRLRADNNGHKDLQIVTHEEWTKHYTTGRCFLPDSMPWDTERKDPLALALHRESKGNVRWHPNLLTSLRKTGKTDADIECAYREHVQAMTDEPRRARGWQSNAYKWVADFKNAHTAGTSHRWIQPASCTRVEPVSCTEGVPNTT